MSDPYRPAYYSPPPTAGSPYNSQDYTGSDQYGPLTTHHRPSHSSASSGYYPQSQTQLAPVSRPSRHDSSDYLDPGDGHRHDKHRSKSRHSRHSSDEKGRDRSRSRTKEIGATAVGGAAGALVGHKIGHGNIGTLAGLAVGALGARALEQQYEKHEERKRLEDAYDGDRGDRRRDSGGRPGTRERRKSFVAQAQDKVSGFLNPDAGKDKRRSRSHVGTSRSAKYSDSDSEDSYDDRHDRRGSRSDRYGSSGRSRRDDY